MTRPIEIPRILGISWWWLIVACAVESLVRHFCHWHRFESVDILEIWLFVQALWLKRAVPQSRAIYWLAASTIIGIGLSLAERSMNVSYWLDGIVGFTAFATGITGIFACRWAMEHCFDETRGLKLAGFMTFFFNVLYFQYHFHDIYRDQHCDQMSITPAAA